MSLGFGQLIIILLIILLLFGAGKLPSVMSDLGKGLKSFKKGLNEEDEPDENLTSKELESKKQNDDEDIKH